jgi:hypothetical protein
MLLGGKRMLRAHQQMPPKDWPKQESVTKPLKPFEEIYINLEL